MFKFKWSVHGLGIIMAAAFLFGASALVPSELSKRLFGQGEADVVVEEDEELAADCSAFSSRALDLSKMNRYFSGGNGSPIEFDEGAARGGGFNAESVALAKDLGAFSNDYARSDRDGPPSKTARVDWLFQCAGSNLAKSTPAETEKDDIEILGECTDKGYTQNECTCGTWEYPKPTSAEDWSDTKQEPSAHDHLLGQGFHRTYWPFAISNDPREYTKPHTYQSNLCGNNTFRDHAIVYNITDFRTQMYTGVTPPGEPNPEVHESGPWPYLIWPAYVAWWHLWHTQ